MALEPTLMWLRRFVTWPILASRQYRLDQRQVITQEARDGLFALADQAIVSGVNFMTTLALARYLSPINYGYYTLLFAVLLFINGVQTALITSPLMVLAPRYKSHERPSYLNSLWCVQLAGCLIAGSVMSLVMFVDQHWGPGITTAIEIVPFALVITAYLGQEFVRRALFVQRESIAGLSVDVISYGLQSLVLVALIAQERLTLNAVLWAMGLTSFIGCLFGLARLRLVIVPISSTTIFTTWQQHWEHGRWLVSSTLAQWSSSQFYFFVVAVILSPADTALLAASRNVLGFTHILLLGLENFVPSTVARILLHNGVDSMVQWLKRFRLVTFLCVGAYCVIVASFAAPLMRLLFGVRYEGTGLIVMLIAVVYFIAPFIYPSMFALRAMGAPRWIFIVRLIPALVTIVISIPIVVVGGVVGAAIGMIITQMLVFILSTVGYRRVLTSVRSAP